MSRPPPQCSLAHRVCTSRVHICRMWVHQSQAPPSWCSMMLLNTWFSLDAKVPMACRRAPPFAGSPLTCASPSLMRKGLFPHASPHLDPPLPPPGPRGPSGHGHLTFLLFLQLLPWVAGQGGFEDFRVRGLPKTVIGVFFWAFGSRRQPSSPWGEQRQREREESPVRLFSE